MFDGLVYLRKLEAAGVSRIQAEAHAGGMVEAINMNLATRDDMHELRHAMKEEMRLLRRDYERGHTEVKKDFANLQSEFAGLRVEFADIRIEFGQLRDDVKGLESRLMFRLGGLLVVLATIGFSVGFSILGFLIQKH